MSTNYALLLVLPYFLRKMGLDQLLKPYLISTMHLEASLIFRWPLPHIGVMEAFDYRYGSGIKHHHNRIYSLFVSYIDNVRILCVNNQVLIHFYIVLTSIDF